MPKTNWLQWPSYSHEEAERVQKVLLSNRVNYWTGSEGCSFEKEFAEFSQSRFAIAVANGTLALELAWRALGLGPGDEVIVTSRSFIASATTIMCCGARPVFADVDRDSQNITVTTIEPLITPRTKAILCVHLAGWPCEMDDILDLARAHDLTVVEDCAQAHGAKYRSKSVGSFGAVGAWSFCQDKIITTGGEGGMLTTQDDSLWELMWSYKDHGKSWQAVHETGDRTGPGFRWLHERPGTNARMTEMQAAIGRIQLKRMDDWNRARAQNAAALRDAASRISSFRVPSPPDYINHGWYKFYVFVKPEALKSGWSRDRILVEINRRGVPCHTGSCSEIYLEKVFEGTDMRPRRRLPVARELGETSLMFEVHPILTPDHMDLAADVMNSVLGEATR